MAPLQVTGRRLWKNVYDELGGSPGSTSAATCTRRHYERCEAPGVTRQLCWAVGLGAGAAPVAGGVCVLVGQGCWRSRPGGSWGGPRGWEPPASPAPWQHALFFPRLVLPYVRHLKGEDDKPLPPSKPRKQYKMAKEPRGDDGATERPKKVKEEKRVDQVSSEPHPMPLKAPPTSSLWLQSSLPGTPRTRPSPKGSTGRGARVTEWFTT